MYPSVRALVCVCVTGEKGGLTEREADEYQMNREEVCKLSLSVYAPRECVFLCVRARVARFCCSLLGE